MNRVRCLGVLALAGALSSTTVWADVKTEEKTQIKFEGMLGRMFGLFGGKAAREGVVNTVAVSGDRKLTMSDYGGEIVDLSEEKIYTLDVKKKTYTVMTFAELRQKMEEARRKAEEDARKASRDAGEKEEQGRKKRSRSISISRTRGRRKRSTATTRDR